MVEDCTLNDEFNFLLTGAQRYAAYQKKAEAPIYFGGFKVAKSAYTPDNTTQYLDISKLETEYYNKVNVADGETGCLILVPNIAEPEMANMNQLQINNYRKIYTRPNAILMPCSVVDTYDITMTNAASVERWVDYITDGEKIMYNGNEYYFYVMYSDDLKVVKTTEYIEYTLKLNKK